MSKKKAKISVGTVTVKEQLKASKPRLSEYRIPRCGFYKTEKDRPRKKIKPKDADLFI